MQFFMKKVTLFLGALLGTYSASIYGDFYQDYDCCPISQPCVDPCCDTLPCCQPRCSFKINGSVLYWRAFEGGLVSGCGPVTITETVNGAVTTSDLTSNTHDLHFPWNTGFRINVGLYNECWFFEQYYTHFRACAHRNQSDSLFWQVCLDELDERVGYSFRLNDCLAFNVFAGIRGALIHQKFNRNFTSSTTGSGITTFFTTDINAKDDFKGIGPLFGLGAEWKMACGFGLFADVNVSDLFGNSHVKNQKKTTYPTRVNSDDLRRHVWATQLVFDYEIGLEWELCLCCFKIIPQIAWEQHWYFNQSRMGGYGDLCFSGLSASLGIEF